MLTELASRCRERCLVALLRLGARAVRRGERPLEIGARVLFVPNLRVELGLASRGFPGRRQALARRALVRVLERGLRGGEAPFQIAVARPDVLERRAQFSFACAEARRFGRARFVIVPRGAECGLEIAQLRRHLDHRRRVARLRFVAGASRFSECRFEGHARAPLGVDQGLELALTERVLVGRGEPILCRLLPGGLSRIRRVQQPSFERGRLLREPPLEVLDARGCRRTLRRELHFPLGQALELGGGGRVILAGAFRFDRRGAQLFVDDLPARRRPRHRRFVLEVALDELVGGVGHRRRMTPLGLLEGRGRFGQFSFEIGQPRMVGASRRDGWRRTVRVLRTARAGHRADDDHRQIPELRRVPLDVMVRAGRGSRRLLPCSFRRDDDDGRTRRESTHTRLDRAPALGVDLPLHDQGGDVLVLGNPARRAIRGRRPGDRPVARNCAHGRPQVLCV